MADAKMPEKLGRYEVIRELGKGAMGVVYEGKDPNIGRRVAIKTARREIVEASGMADEMMERFLREAQAAGALNHPNIITIYDAAEEDGIAYIAMEYLEGGDLGDVIEAKKRLGMDEIVHIGACICEALAVAHESGVVHRDIKPANILMPTGQPLKVADFGIAHVSDSNLTQDGALIGTPHYMSPEQFMGQKLDGRSDLFSVGNILYELSTGEKPFGGEALSTVMHHVIKTDPVNPTELNFNIPDALAQVIMKALSKRPTARYKNGREMAAALGESIKENPNPGILDPSATIGMEATITGAVSPAAAQGATQIGTPPSAAGATMAGGAPASEDMIATVAGVRPSTQETTIADAPGATLPGGSPAPLNTTVPGHAPSPPAAPEARGSNKMLLAGGAIAALVVIVAGIMMVSGGGGDTPPANAAGSSSQPAETVADANFYTDLTFEIFRTRTMDDYKAYDKGQITLDSLNGKLDEVQGTVAIKIIDANGSAIADSAEWEAGDLIDLSAAPKSNKLRYRVTVPEPTPENPGGTIEYVGEIPPATAQGASGQIPLILRPLNVN